MPDWPRLLRREMAASYIGVSPTKFSEMVTTGALPQPLSLSGTVVAWDRMDLDGWVESLRDSPNGNGWDETAA
jgi:predicted DNA-binding transcriptional regulator AlpA